MPGSRRERVMAACAVLVVAAYAAQRLAGSGETGGPSRAETRLAYYQALREREGEILHAYEDRAKALDQKPVEVSDFFKEADRIARAHRVKLRNLKPLSGAGKDAGALLALEGGYAGLVGVFGDIEREFPKARIGRFSIAARGQDAALHAQAEVFLAAP